MLSLSAGNRSMSAVNSVTSVFLASTTCKQTIQPAVIRVSALRSQTSVQAPPGDVIRYYTQCLLCVCDSVSEQLNLLIISQAFFLDILTLDILQYGELHKVFCILCSV